MPARQVRQASVRRGDEILKSVDRKLASIMNKLYELRATTLRDSAVAQVSVHASRMSYET